MPTGKIKIGIPPLIGTLFFPLIAKKFKLHYPDVSLELIELGAKRIEHLVEEGQVDVGIIVFPTDLDKFSILPFIKEEFMLYTSRNHRLSKVKEVALQQLKEENFIVFNREFALNKLIIKECQKAGFQPNIAYESSQWDLITELVGAELGITLLPKSIYRKMDHNMIEMIKLSSPPMWELGFITKKDRYQSFAVRALLEFVSEVF